MYVTLEVNHPDEVSTNFMMLSIKGGCEKATYGHTPQLVHTKESKTNGYFSLRKETWQIAPMLQCFEGFLLTGFPNINNPSVPITFTYLDFSAPDGASSYIFPLIFLAFSRHGRYTQMQCVLMGTHMGKASGLCSCPFPQVSQPHDKPGWHQTERLWRTLRYLFWAR